MAHRTSLKHLFPFAALSTLHPYSETEDGESNLLRMLFRIYKIIVANKKHNLIT